MTEMSTTVRSETMAAASKVDYISWLDYHLNDQSSLDLAALNEHEGAASYKTVVTPETSAAPEISDESAPGTPEYQQQTDVLKQEQKSEKWYRKIGAQILMLGAGRSEWFSVKENDSRAKKFGKTIMRKTLDHSMLVLPVASLAASIGSVAYTAIALKYGFDVPAPTAHQASPEWHEAIGSSPIEAHPAAPAPAAAIDIPVPAPKPAPIDVLAHQKIVPAPAPVHTYQPTHVDVPVHAKEPTPASDALPAPHHGEEIAVTTGGATDGSGDGIMGTLIDNHTLDPTKTNIIKNVYPGEMAPFVGSTPTQESIAIAVQNAKDIMAQHPGAHFTFYGFSEGGLVNDELAHQLHQAGIHNVDYVTYGDGNGAPGLLNSPPAETFRSFVDGFGIKRIPIDPDVEMRHILTSTDGYGATANGSIPDLLSDAMGSGHRIVAPDELRVEEFDVGKDHYEVVGDPIPLPPNAVLTKGVAAPGFGGLPEIGADSMPQAPADIPPLDQAPQMPPAPMPDSPAPVDALPAPEDTAPAPELVQAP